MDWRGQKGGKGTHWKSPVLSGGDDSGLDRGINAKMERPGQTRRAGLEVAYMRRPLDREGTRP